MKVLQTKAEMWETRGLAKSAIWSQRRWSWPAVRAMEAGIGVGAEGDLAGGRFACTTERENGRGCG